MIYPGIKTHKTFDENEPIRVSYFGETCGKLVPKLTQKGARRFYAQDRWGRNLGLYDGVNDALRALYEEVAG